MNLAIKKDFDRVLLENILKSVILFVLRMGVYSCFVPESTKEKLA
jgi:hypothetical protein